MHLHETVSKKPEQSQKKVLVKTAPEKSVHIADVDWNSPSHSHRSSENSWENQYLLKVVDRVEEFAGVCNSIYYNECQLNFNVMGKGTKEKHKTLQCSCVQCPLAKSIVGAPHCKLY